MTVAELIAELQKMPADAEVSTEGCDCEGTADGCALVTEYIEYGLRGRRRTAKLDQPYVLITRSN